jgi:argininosuccinate lyase
MDALNRSIGTDIRLWPYDIRLSKAWAVALWGAGVLTVEESARMEEGLDAVGERLAAGVEPEPSDEDVHTLIDRLLHDEIGDLASRLHTGRSRNDQVATATRLWTMDAIGALDASVRELQQTMISRAEELGDAVMPAYTHMQQAQPVLVSHWMLSHFWPLERDRARLSAVAQAASVLPLGSGAIAGCAFPVSRVLLQGSLGFSSLSQNSMDAVADRDFAAELLFALSLMGTHLSRLSEDLIMFGSTEFGFVRFGHAFTTGSSMMPQKRNPDALEIARGGAGRMLGDLVSLLVTMKGLPSGYNKDLQDDKRAVFGAVDAMLLTLPAVSGTLAELTFVPSRMREHLGSSMMATDLADYLVGKGVTFREAHAAVGSLVREGEASGKGLHGLPLESFRKAHASFGDDVMDSLSPERSVARRKVPGGTASDTVAQQLEAARSALRPAHEVVSRGNELDVRALLNQPY